ncbi:threonine/serine exporter family protein [Chitinolyticbacter meiyuanensis]|uniref:threonine/serine exporter family protein n=1 Tax=Chitinolyticbacter meiyuanensis TaxID=682798 RepID=UPI0011E58A21|nr:threonine/serine exporter family protein [Chitinolyticbacter meiyuanensis]
MSWLVELWSIPAALGFAVLFNVPPRTLWLSCALALAGHGLRFGLLHAGSDIVLGTLLAALLIGICAEWWSRRARQAAPVYAVCAAIPMVPGTYMYKAVQALLQLATVTDASQAQPHLVDAGYNIVKAAMILLALAIGIAAPALLWPKKGH